MTLLSAMYGGIVGTGWLEPVLPTVTFPDTGTVTVPDAGVVKPPETLPVELIGASATAAPALVAA